MDRRLADACAPLVLRSRAVVLVALVVELALIMPRALGELRVWAVVVLGVGLGHAAILLWLRRVDASPRAVRAAFVLLTAAAASLGAGLVFGLSGGVTGLKGFALVAAVVALLALPPAALGYAAIEGSLPDELRDRARPARRRASMAARVGLLLAWLSITGVGFWCLTALTGDASCVEDGACRFGIPLRFARFGTRSGGSSMDWLIFAQDLGLFATLLPAAYASARLRPRWPFVVYVALVGGWIAWAAFEGWGGEMSMRLWLDIDLRELGR